MDRLKDSQAAVPTAAASVTMPTGAPTVAAAAKGDCGGQGAGGARGGARTDYGEGKVDRRVGAHGGSGTCDDAYEGSSDYGDTRNTFMGGGGSLDGGYSHSQGSQSDHGSGRSNGDDVDSTKRTQPRETGRGSDHDDVQCKGLHWVEAYGAKTDRAEVDLGWAGGDGAGSGLGSKQPCWA
jgi:hypothetical protein